MAQIKSIGRRDGPTINHLLAVWRSAVIPTHTFLRAADVTAIEPDVQKALLVIEHLYGFYGDSHQIEGFIGVEKQKVEMLFVDADARGKGIGKQLLCFALTELCAKYVDVNEQNEQAAGFYQHMGFVVIGRSSKDGQGRPFPLLHLAKN